MCFDYGGMELPVLPGYPKDGESKPATKRERARVGWWRSSLALRFSNSKALGLGTLFVNRFKWCTATWAERSAWSLEPYCPTGEEFHGNQHSSISCVDVRLLRAGHGLTAGVGPGTRSRTRGSDRLGQRSYRRRDTWRRSDGHQCRHRSVTHRHYKRNRNIFGRTIASGYL